MCSWNNTIARREIHQRFSLHGCLQSGGQDYFDSRCDVSQDLFRIPIGKHQFRHIIAPSAQTTIGALLKPDCHLKALLYVHSLVHKSAPSTFLGSLVREAESTNSNLNWFKMGQNLMAYTVNS